jgi:hypothetical protein
LLEDLPGKGVLLKQVAELEQGGGVGNRLTPEGDPCKVTHRTAVADGVLVGFIGEPPPLL